MKNQDLSYWQQTANIITNQPNPEWIELLRNNLELCHSGKLAAYLKARVDSAESQKQAMLAGARHTVADW